VSTVHASVIPDMVVLNVLRLTQATVALILNVLATADVKTENASVILVGLVPVVTLKHNVLTIARVMANVNGDLVGVINIGHLRTAPKLTANSQDPTRVYQLLTDYSFH